MTRSSRAAAAAAVFALLAGAPSAHAGLITYNATPYTGAPAAATVAFDDVTNPGAVRVTVTVDASVALADINGFFFNVKDEALLAALAASGGDVTQVVKSANGVTSAGPGNNINGQGVGPFDVGLRIGTPGIGKDDIQTTTFFLSAPGVTLTNNMFTGAPNEDGDIFALRLTSVGPAGARNGSSKLRNGGEVPPPITPPEQAPPPDLPPPVHTPEPSTLAGCVTLWTLAVLGRRLRR